MLATRPEDAAVNFKRFAPNLDVTQVVRVPDSMRDRVHRTKKWVGNAIAFADFVAVYGGAVVAVIARLFK